MKSRISNLVHNAFRKKDGRVRYTHIKVTRAQGYFTHDINDSGNNMYAADNICKMIEFLIDNIFVQFGGRLFHHLTGIAMGTNCAPLLADLFLYSYEDEFLDNMIKSGRRRLPRSFNLCYRYMDDLIVCHSILECCVMFSGINLSMGSFVIFGHDRVVSRTQKKF